jgi:hypothetical protein
MGNQCTQRVKTSSTREMQGFIQHWEGGLRATGGAVYVDKSFWYLIDFEWKNNKWQYHSFNNMPGNISVRDSVGTPYIPQDSTFLPGLHPNHCHTKPLLHLQVHAHRHSRMVTTTRLPPGHHHSPSSAACPTDFNITPPTIHAAMQALPPLDCWAVLDYFFPDDGQTVAEGIISGSATAVSDGSFKSQFGTSGFVIRGNDRRLGAIWVNAVPGLPDEHSSYRSELVGISGSLAIIYAVDTPYRKVPSH